MTYLKLAVRKHDGNVCRGTTDGKVDEQTGTIYYTGDDRITFWGNKHGEMPVKHLDPEADEEWPSKHRKSSN